MKKKSLAWTTFLEKNGLRQQDVAEFLGISRVGVSYYVAGRHKPKKAHMDKILSRADWDTSMFDGPDEIIKFPGPNDDERVAELVRRAERAEALCEEYLAIIKALTKAQ